MPDKGVRTATTPAQIRARATAGPVARQPRAPNQPRPRRCPRVRHGKVHQVEEHGHPTEAGEPLQEPPLAALGEGQKCETAAHEDEQEVEEGVLVEVETSSAVRTGRPVRPRAGVFTNEPQPGPGGHRAGTDRREGAARPHEPARRPTRSRRQEPRDRCRTPGSRRPAPRVFQGEPEAGLGVLADSGRGQATVPVSPRASRAAGARTKERAEHACAQGPQHAQVVVARSHDQPADPGELESDEDQAAGHQEVHHARPPLAGGWRRPSRTRRPGAQV